MKRALLALPLVACGADPEPADVTLTPIWDAPGAPVPATVRGHNTVWSRDGLGLWDAAAGDVDGDVWPHVEALAPGALRFPGGTRALRWHFASARGDQREPQCDTFTGVLDATTYGPAEMLAVAARAGAPVSLVTPLSDGTPEEAAALLAYVSGSPDSAAPIGTDRAGVAWETAGAWAARRDADGAPPADVRLVEIGNEPYLDLAVGPSTSCGRDGRFRQSERWEGDVEIPITAADYAAQVALHAAALRAVDPDVVIGAAAMDDAAAVGPHDGASGDIWNTRLVADAGDAFDAFVLHPYDFSADDSRAFLAERARVSAAALRELAPDKQIAITEFGTLFDADTMLNAIITADMTRVAVEDGWLASFRHILVEDDPSGPFAESAAILGPAHTRTPGWHVSRLLAEHLLPRAVPIFNDLDADVVALATTDDAGGLAFVVIDRRATGEPRSVSIVLPAGAYAGSSHQLSAPGLTRDDVSLVDADVSAEGAVTLETPPASVTVMRLDRGL